MDQPRPAPRRPDAYVFSYLNHEGVRRQVPVTGCPNVKVARDGLAWALDLQPEDILVAPAWT